MGTFVAVLVMRQIERSEPEIELEDRKSWLMGNIFTIFPQFNFAFGMFEIYVNSNLKKSCGIDNSTRAYCESQNLTFTENSWGTDPGGIGTYLIALVVESIFFFCLLLLIQNEITNNLFQKLAHFAKFQKSSNYSEVSHGRYPLEVTNLTKDYTGRCGGKCCCSGAREQMRAVDGVSFVVKPNECFGLLGPNGAGKSTTFKILTGELESSSGLGAICGHDINHERAKAMKCFGYCPQFDALLNQLTGRETLEMYGRIRGLPETSLTESVDRILQIISITQHANKRVSTYSGGTKRKLSVGISLLGFSPVIMMDEPSCGLDPASRENLWNIIQGIIKSGTSILLTSHSMEEATALCQRVGIMVKGKFKDCGTQHYLKSKYGCGFNIEIQADRRYHPELKSTLERKLPSNSRLVCGAQFWASVTFHLTLGGNDSNLGPVFGVLEKMKSEFTYFGGYSLSQPTLEQIFLQLSSDDETNSIGTDFR